MYTYRCPYLYELASRQDSEYRLLGLSILAYLGILHLERTQIFRKTNICYPLIRTRTCADQGVTNFSFQKILRTY